MNELIKIERINKENIKDLIPLCKTVFRKRTSVSYWQKKLDSSVFGVSYLGSIAYDKDRKAVAYYAVYPCRMKLNGDMLMAAVAGDGMTIMEHRGKGLFTALLKRTHDLAISNGIKFIFGFPNQDSEKSFARVGIRNEKARMNIYALSVQTIPLSKIHFLNFLVRPWQRLILSRYNSIDKTLHLSNWDNDHVVHDNDFYKYKTDKNKFILKINDRKVWVKVDKVFKIGDLEGINENDQIGFVNKLKQLAFWLGCTEIQFATNVNSSFTDELKGRNCSINSFPIVQIDLRSDDLPDPSVQYVSCDNDTF